MKNSTKIFYGEFIGSCFLVMIIVGSGIMAQNLTEDIAVMLIANTLATGAGLFVLINSIGDISGAHFNPIVTLAMYFTKKIKKNLILTYISAQILGCMLGVMLANFMFDLPLLLDEFKIYKRNKTIFLKIPNNHSDIVSKQVTKRLKNLAKEMNVSSNIIYS